jgi:hypothetical protein
MSDRISIRTFVYDTGICRKGSVLMPIEAVERLSHKARAFWTIEGSLEFHIGAVAILTNESLPMGYIDGWWEDGIAAVADLLALRSTCWRLPGKVCWVEIEVVPGTRRARVWAQLSEDRGGGPHSATAECRVPELAEAMLAEAERFFVWLDSMNMRSGTDEILARVRELRHGPAPWRA